MPTVSPKATAGWPAEVSCNEGETSGLGDGRRPLQYRLIPMHILVVEDDRDIADLVGRALEKAGYTTEILGSGRDAIATIAARPSSAPTGFSGPGP